MMAYEDKLTEEYKIYMKFMLTYDMDFGGILSPGECLKKMVDETGAVNPMRYTWIKNDLKKLSYNEIVDMKRFL